MWHDEYDEEPAGTKGNWDHVDPDALKALEEAAAMERQVYPEKDGAELAQQILEDAAPAAAASIVKIATSEPNPNTRLRAAQYIIDRALGTKGADPAKTAPWTGIFAEVTTEAAR